VRQTEQLKYLVGRDGRLTLPLEIEGAMLSPSIGVDLGQAFSNQLNTEDTQEKVKGLIRGLLDRD
jgi:carbamate kinase